MWRVGRHRLLVSLLYLHRHGRLRHAAGCTRRRRSPRQREETRRSLFPSCRRSMAHVPTLRRLLGRSSRSGALGAGRTAQEGPHCAIVARKSKVTDRIEVKRRSKALKRPCSSRNWARTACCGAFRTLRAAIRPSGNPDGHRSWWPMFQGLRLLRSASRSVVPLAHSGHSARHLPRARQPIRAMGSEVDAAQKAAASR